MRACASHFMDIKTAIGKTARMMEYRVSEGQCVSLASKLREFTNQYQEFMDDDGVLDEAAGLLEALALVFEDGRINLAQELREQVERG